MHNTKAAFFIIPALAAGLFAVSAAMKWAGPQKSEGGAATEKSTPAVPAVVSDAKLAAGDNAEQGAGENADAISGSMTMEEIISRTGVPQDYIIRYLSLPACAEGDLKKPANEWLGKHDRILDDLREAIDRYRRGFRL